MPRAIWSGSISFGLVNVPVKLYSAVHSQGLSFRQFEEGTNARVRNKRVSKKTGKVLTREFDPKRYEDTYRIEVLDYLKKKASGKEIVVEEEPEEQAEVVDLMAALEASLEAAKKSGSRRRSSSSASKKSSSPAKKAPAKQSSSTSRRSSSGSKRKSA